MEFYPLDILINVINIAVLYILLRLILYKPVARFLSARAERIGDQIAKADEKLLEAERINQEYRAKLDQAVEEGHAAVRAEKTRAAQEAQAIIAEAKTESQRLLDEAHDRIKKEKERALEQMQYEVAQISVDIASRILKREVSVADNMRLTEEFFRELRTK